MPEGPSTIILAEAIHQFKGKKILTAAGIADIDMDLLPGHKLTDIKTFGKNTLLCLPGNKTIRIHLMMFGSYEIDSEKDRKPKLCLTFANGYVCFYTCIVEWLEGNPDDFYDWSADIMHKKWSTAKAKKKLLEKPEAYICDTLLNQEIFAGVGNIIKNEGLFLGRIHPETKVGAIPAARLIKLINKTREYTFNFLKWKKAGELKKRWLVYTKKKCPVCDSPLEKKYTGTTKRRTFFCSNCQEKFK